MLNRPASTRSTSRVCDRSPRPHLPFINIFFFVHVCLAESINSEGSPVAVIMSHACQARVCRLVLYNQVANKQRFFPRPLTMFPWPKIRFIVHRDRFIYSLIHFFIYSFIQLFIYLFIHLFSYSFIYLFIHSFIHLLIYSFAHLFIYLLIYLFIFFIFSFIPLFIYSFIH